MYLSMCDFVYYKKKINVLKNSATKQIKKSGILLPIQFLQIKEMGHHLLF